MHTKAINDKRQETRNSSRATSMAELLKSVKASFIAPRKGYTVSGIITKLTPQEILVDINAKTEAVVLEKDKKILNKILSYVKFGDKVSVTVLNPEGDLGSPVVSLRKFIDDIVWEKLEKLKKDQEILDVIVEGATKGGFLVDTVDGISGFLPNSHTSSLQNPQNLIGKSIKVVVLDLARPTHKIIFSQKQIVDIKDFQKLIKNLKVGQKIDAIITNIVPFGIFSLLPINSKISIEGFVHISEISWDNIDSIPQNPAQRGQNFSPGQKITTVVLGFDEESRRVNLSIKRLTPDPLLNQLKKFTIDKKLRALIIKIISAGVILDLGEGIEGIIKKDKIPPKISYTEGLELEVVVTSIDEKRRRVVVVPVLLEKPIGYR